MNFRRLNLALLLIRQRTQQPKDHHAGGRTKSGKDPDSTILKLVVGTAPRLGQEAAAQSAASQRHRSVSSMPKVALHMGGLHWPEQ